jgi:epoxyqueuosine reductase QueG
MLDGASLVAALRSAAKDHLDKQRDFNRSAGARAYHKAQSENMSELADVIQSVVSSAASGPDDEAPGNV